MPISESIGGVSVSITGDIAPLKASFTQAQASAQQAGAGVAAAFTGGASAIAGAQQAVIVATQNLQSAQKALASFIVAGNQTAIGAVAGYKAALAGALANLAQMSGATNTAAGAQVAFAAATTTSSAALSHEVSQIQATSGALRVLEGSGGIRAAERFLTMIPGLGSALQMAFPVIGAIALFDAMDKLLGKATGLKEAEEELATQTKATDDAFSRMVQTIDHINVGAITREFGTAAGQISKAKELGEEAKDAQQKILGLVHQLLVLDKETTDISQHPILLVPHYSAQFQEAQADKIKAVGEQIDAIQEDIRVKQKQADDETAAAAKTSAGDAGQLQAARIDNQIKANAALANLTRTQAEIQISTGHSVQQAQINEIQDSQSRAVASAAEQVRVALETRDALSKIDSDATQRHIAQVQAKAAADSLGKTPIEAQRVQVAARGDIAGLTADQYQKETVLQGAFIKATGAFDDAVATQQRDLTEGVAKEGEKRLSTINKQVDDMLSAAKRFREQTARVGEIEAKGAGTNAELTVQANKLAFERAYGIESLHTGAQNVEYARQLAEYDAQGRAAKLAGLQAELLIAQNDFENENHLVKAATIQQQINALKLEGANIDTAAATKNEQAAERLTLQYKLHAALKNAGAQIPGALGQTLATGLTGGGPKGENAGKQVADALKGIGVHLLGDIMTAMIEKLIATVITQFGLDILNQWLVHYASNPLGLFAAGGSPPVGIPSMVGERGPELFVPTEAGVIIPNHQLGNFTGGGLPMPRIGLSSSTSNSSSVGQMNFHIHDATDARETVRQIARFLKSAGGPQFAAFSK